MTAVRSPLDEDAASIATLVNGVTADWFAWAPATPDELLDWWRAPRADRRDFIVAEGSNGIVGYGRVFAGDRGYTRLWAEIRALAGPGEDAVSAKLLFAIEARARQLATRGDPGARVVLRTQVADRQARLEQLLGGAAGYTVVRHAALVARDLDPPPAAPPWPQGVTVRHLQQGDEPGIWKLSMDALSSTWDFVREPFPSWLASQVESEDFDPRLWLVAESDDGEIAGVVYGRDSRADPVLGWLDVLAVRPDWRRRRLGIALMQEALREFQRRGKHRAGCGTDPDNPTGIGKLLTRLDFETVQRFSTFEKELRPERSAARVLGRSTRNVGRAWRRLRLLSGVPRGH